MIHSLVLASKDLSPILAKFLQITISVVKYIKTRPLETRIFTETFEEIGTECASLLLTMNH